MDGEEKRLENIWKAVLLGIRGEVSEGAFNTYIRNATLVRMIESDTNIEGEIEYNSAFVKNTIEQRYKNSICGLLKQITNKEWALKGRVVSKSKMHQVPENEGPLFESGKKTQELIKRANLKNELNFENYAVGGSNQMAFAAAQAVARKPGSTYNPLFIYGGVGVGKTHLMQAIGCALSERGENNILFCTGEEFTNDLVEAIRYKTTDKVRGKYRKMKLLMIDDVQFIAGKPTVQEEFFHTFNAILKEGGQVVMTSDKPPGEIAKLEERLKSRFGAGLIVDIGPADFELRTAILLIKAKQKNFNLPMEIAQTIASNIEGVRELQGFLVRLITEAEIMKEELTLEKVESILKVTRPNGNQVKVVTPAEVMSTVGNYYGVGVQMLKGERRTKVIAWPRQILMYLLRQELRLPLEEVGRLIGGRDHTTVLHAFDKVKLEMDVNQTLKNEINELKRRLFT